MRFSLSTQPFRDRPLTPALLEAVAEAGFDHLEVFAAQAGLDEGSAEITSLARRLDTAGLGVSTLHAATRERRQGTWQPIPSLAHADAAKRRVALATIERAVSMRTELVFDTLVVHLGLPDHDAEAAAANTREAARRSLEHVAEITAAAGIRVALEVQASRLASVEGLVALIDDDLDAPHVGLCFDFGHAHLSGDVVDALEGASGHVIATHLHDNRGVRDDHLWPFDGTIDWGASLMTLQKLGFEGAHVLTPAAIGETPEALTAMLARATAARQQLFDALYAM